VLLGAFGAAMIACNTAWTFVFLRAITEAMIGVRTGINSAIYQLGGAMGGTVASVLLATFGLTDTARLLRERGVPPEQMAAVLAATNALLDPNTPDPATLDPAVAQQLIVGYQAIYIASYERVLYIVAAVCLGGATVAWFALRARARREEMKLAPE
jgi:hypothetical protein